MRAVGEDFVATSRGGRVAAGEFHIERSSERGGAGNRDEAKLVVGRPRNIDVRGSGCGLGKSAGKLNGTSR